MRRDLVLVGCCAALLAPAAAWGEDHKIEGPGRTVLVVTAKGAVGLYTGGHPDCRETDWGGGLRVTSDLRQGYYLAYDPTGKKPGVFLTKDSDDKGARWEVKHVSNTGRHIQAASGKV